MFFVYCENRVKRELRVGILYYGTIIAIRHQNKGHRITVHNYKPKTMQKNSPLKDISSYLYQKVNRQQRAAAVQVPPKSDL